MTFIPYSKETSTWKFGKSKGKLENCGNEKKKITGRENICYRHFLIFISFKRRGECTTG